MDETRRLKAIEALNKKKDRERMQRRAMLHHWAAYAKLHFDGVVLPYRILLDIERREHDGEFKEVCPNPYYPCPALSLKAVYSRPTPPTDKKDLPLNEHGLPDAMSDAEFRAAYKEYEQRVEAEKMPLDKWGYYYGKFLTPYNLEAFSTFDFWGKVPEDAEEKKVVEDFRAVCLEVWRDCKEHPENYNFEPVPRLEEHIQMYDVGYGYLRK